MDMARVNVDMDPGYRPFILMALLGIAIVIVAQVGARLGWWNDLGEWATLVGLFVTILAAGFGVFYGASKPEVRGVGAAVADVGKELAAVRGAVTEGNGKLDKLDAMDGKLDTGNDLLRDIRDAVRGGA
jgi:hypothetical protein